MFDLPLCQLLIKDKSQDQVGDYFCCKHLLQCGLRLMFYRAETLWKPYFHSISDQPESCFRVKKLYSFQWNWCFDAELDPTHFNKTTQGRPHKNTTCLNFAATQCDVIQQGAANPIRSNTFQGTFLLVQSSRPEIRSEFHHSARFLVFTFSKQPALSGSFSVVLPLHLSTP